MVYQSKITNLETRAHPGPLKSGHYHDNPEKDVKLSQLITQEENTCPVWFTLIFWENSILVQKCWLQWLWDVDVLEQIQCWSEGWNASPVKAVWDKLRLFSLKKGRLWGTFVAPSSTEKRDGNGLFRRARSDRIKRDGFKTTEGRFKLGIRKKFITISVVRHWNRLLGEVVNAYLPEVLEAKLDKALNNVVYRKVIMLVNTSLCELINLYFFTEIKIPLIKRKLEKLWLCTSFTILIHLRNEQSVSVK